MSAETIAEERLIQQHGTFLGDGMNLKPSSRYSDCREELGNTSVFKGQLSGTAHIATE